jgi:ADP-ribosylation factor protein 1/Arf/Sar family protein
VIQIFQSETNKVNFVARTRKKWGQLWESHLPVFFHQEESRIVLFGLDAAGKSSIMHKLKTGETLTTTMPTVGLNVESVKYKDSNLCFWEMGGQQCYKVGESC